MTAMMAMPPVVPVNHRPLRAVTHVIAMIDANRQGGRMTPMTLANMRANGVR